MSDIIATPTITSPYRLIQEDLRDSPWKLLVACMMLNQTSAKQVKNVIDTFFKKWPHAYSCAYADPDEISKVLRPLGFQNRRSRSIIRMSQQYVIGMYKSGVENLHGIGKYAADSYKIFCENKLILDVEDKELKNYVKWALNLKEA